MPQYMLLLRDQGAFDWSAEEMQRVIERYGVWSDGLREKGLLRGGEKLRDGEGRVLRKNGSDVTVMDGPFAETKEILGGYFVVEAGSYEEAIELTRECPHYEFGSIELRQIEDTSEIPPQ